MLNRLTSFVWEVEGAIPIRDVNLGATVHQMIRNNDLRSRIVEERINGEEDDDQGETMRRTAPLKEMFSSE